MKTVAILFLTLASAVLADAQFSRTIGFRGAAAQQLQGTGGGGGGANYALVDVQSNGVVSSGTATITLNTTGCKLIAVLVANYNDSPGVDIDPTNISDPSAIFKAGVLKGAPAGQGTNQWFYCTNFTASASYTIIASHNYTCLVGYSFSYSGTTPSIDSQAVGAQSNSFITIQPGSVTPSGSNRLFLFGITWLAGTLAVDSSFTNLSPIQAAASGLFGGAAIKISSSAENPTAAITGGATQGGCNMMVWR